MARVTLHEVENSTDPLFKFVLSLRYEVLRKPHGQQPIEPWPLDGPESWHVLARDAESEMALGTVSFHRKSGSDTGRLYQMAVDTQQQSKGVGKALAEHVISRAKAEGIKEIVLSGRTTAAGFYEKFGFRVRGDVFLLNAIEHVEMSLQLC